MDDPATHLQRFIAGCSQESGPDWEYINSPYLREYLNGLNPEETEQFSRDVLAWTDEFHLYEIADAILLCNNRMLRQEYLYARLFTRISHVEYLEYLLQNLYPTPQELRSWDAPTLRAVAEQISRVLIGKDDYWKTHTHELVQQMLDEAASRGGTEPA